MGNCYNPNVVSEKKTPMNHLETYFLIRPLRVGFPTVGGGESQPLGSFPPGGGCQALRPKEAQVEGQTCFET